VSFWEFLWFTIVVFAFVAYLIVLFNIVTDLFRDKELSGWWKALWMLCLVFLPFLTALAYLIFRGKGMAERQVAAVNHAVSAQQEYIKTVAGTANPADQISRAKDLLDAGTISQEEFDAIKAKALA
jgi:signal transduction histidine kinase